MKKKFILPEKWCLFVTEATRDYISDFVHTKLNNEEGYLTTWDISDGFFLHYPFLKKRNDEKGFGHSQQTREEGYKEITFPQFKIYFVDKFNIPENYDYLIPLLINII